MRSFLLLARHAPTSPNFRLNDLPGAGRMDLVCRCVSSALFLSDDIRRDTAITAVLDGPPDPPRAVTFDGARVRRLYPDERNVASHIRIALGAALKAGPGEVPEPEPGITVARKGLEPLLKERAEDGSALLHLHREGEDIRKAELPGDATFILGDHLGLPKATDGLLEQLGARRVSAGRVEYLASHIIAVVQNELDRRARGSTLAAARASSVGAGVKESGAPAVRLASSLRDEATEK